MSYDPTALSISSQDIHLGTVPQAGTGWILAAPVIDPARGELGITLYSLTPISSAVGGSLVTIDFHVLAGAPAAASPIELVAAVNVGGQEIQTALADSQGLLTLHGSSGQWAVSTGQWAVGSGQQGMTSSLVDGQESLAAAGSRASEAGARTAGVASLPVGEENNETLETSAAPAHPPIVPVLVAVFMGGATNRATGFPGPAAQTGGLPLATFASPFVQRLVEQALAEQAPPSIAVAGRSGLEGLLWDAAGVGLGWLPDLDSEMWGGATVQAAAEYAAVDGVFAGGSDDLD